MRPVFCVSDLHMGDKGPRDNFARMAGRRREHEFHEFLDYVEDHCGQLIIIGDLFELWQGNVSKVLTCRLDLLDRLAGMGAKYLLGNHDIDLLHFTWADGMRLTHPLFRNLALTDTLTVHGGKRILLIHGHEQDHYCKSEVPGIGRISAIYTGIKEDRNGGPLAGKYGDTTVESRVLDRFSRWGQVARRLCGQPSATKVMRWAISDRLKDSGCDALIYGHTHQPGQFVSRGSKLPIYNSGTWAERENSFVKIDTDGSIRVTNWVNGQPQPNDTLLVM